MHGLSVLSGGMGVRRAGSWGERFGASSGGHQDARHSSQDSSRTGPGGGCEEACDCLIICVYSQKLAMIFFS